MSLQEYKACIDRKTSSHAGRRAPHDHPDLNSNAFSKICSALPEGTAMHNARVACILLAGLFSPFLFPLLASAAVDCGILPQWVTLGNGMELNQQHVFCGEWSGGRMGGGPKGFHSRPGAVNPSTIHEFRVQDRPSAAGIYTGKWTHRNDPAKTKFSSMFPDNCSVGQVLNSISYASAHADPTCPIASPAWAKCGKSRPTEAIGDELAKYCGNNEVLFVIGFAAPKNNKINTAFPIRE